MRWSVRIQYRKAGVTSQAQYDLKLMNVEAAVKHIQEVIIPEYKNDTIVAIRMVYVHG